MVINYNDDHHGERFCATGYLTVWASLHREEKAPEKESSIKLLRSVKNIACGMYMEIVAFWLMKHDKGVLRTANK